MRPEMGHPDVGHPPTGEEGNSVPFGFAQGFGLRDGLRQGGSPSVRLQERICNSGVKLGVLQLISQPGIHKLLSKRFEL
jgi:hypothetical protein